MTVADRISVMDHGRIVQVAPPAEIYEAPNSRYVADFIGSVNLFEGTVDSGRRRAASSLPAKDGLAIEAASGTACAAGADRLVRGAAREGAHRATTRPPTAARQRGRRRGAGTSAISAT